MNSHTYFISGHIDINPDEFKTHYIHKIDEALSQQDGIFVIGDANGTDTLAQTYLKDKTDKVTIYHIKTSPLNNIGDFKTKGGYKNHNRKDTAMTLISDYDIAWVRPIEDQKKLYGSNYKKRISGTERNIRRRSLLL